MPSNNAPLTKSLIQDLPTSNPDPNHPFYFAENIYAEDWHLRPSPEAGTDFAWNATSQDFSWSGNKSNALRVDWTLIDLPWNQPYEQYYDYHDGPIDFYADTIQKAVSVSEPPGLAKFTANLPDIGWRRSMFYREPQFTKHPATTNAKIGDSVTLDVITVMRGQPFVQPPGLILQWELLQGSTWVGVGSGASSFTIASVTANHAGNKYRVVATLDGLSETSHVATLNVTNSTVASAPAAPTNLDVTPASASQINLGWRDVSSNESGFIIQRKLSSADDWNEIKRVSSGVERYTDMGLAAATSYDYRVCSYNSVNPSGFSNFDSATTKPVATVSFPLAVDAVDLFALQSLAINVYSWEGTSSNFRSNTTSFTRSATVGTKILVAAPATLAGGKVFQYWLKDGANREYSTSVTMTMDGAHSLIAIYGNSPPPGRTLQSISIQGPSSVDERSTASYSARATYTDGTTGIVSAAWSESSSYASVSSNGVLDTSAVSSDKSVTLNASATISGVTKTASKSVTIRNTDAAATYTLTRNSSTGGHIGYSPQAGDYAAGTVVSLHANPDSAYIFSHWSGDASGTEDDITIRMDGNRTVTAHFVPDPTEGSLRVNISPTQAVAEGAQWKYRNYTEWRDSGNTQVNIPPGNGYVKFTKIPGWVTPDEIQTTIVGGQAFTVNATYAEILGSVQVVIEPSEAASAGARWRLNGESVWRESGASATNVATGAHTIEFSPISGWQAAQAMSLMVERGQVAVRTGIYNPPAGLPLITAITPHSGPPEGGITVVIEGTNFGPETTVGFGGVAATGVVVESESRLAAVVPPSASYGSVAVTVTTAGQTATKASGFAYDIPLGVNMTLLSQIGGTVQAVAAAGNLVLFGEGSSLVAADFSNPSSPIIRGRLPLPGLVRDIKIVGNHALVANHQFGLQIVDVTDVTALQRVGFYDTPGVALSLGVSGNLAFIADDSSVQVIDFTNRISPIRVGALATTALEIALTTVGSQRIACVASLYAGVLVLDASVPSNILQLSAIEAGISNDGCSVNGSLVCVNGALDGAPGNVLRTLYDISVPNSPVRKSQMSGNIAGAAALFQGPTLYIGSGRLDIYDISNSATPVKKGTLNLAGSTGGLALTGTTLLLANSRAGLIAVNVGSPTSPSIRSTVNTAFSAGDVVVEGDTAYVAFGGGYSASGLNTPCLTAIDVANRTNIQRGSTITSTQTVERLSVEQHSLFGTTQSNGIAGFNIQNALNPALGTYRFSDRQINVVTRFGQYLLLGGGTEGTGGTKPLLTVIDAANPNNTTPISSFQLSAANGVVDGVASFGNIVFAMLSTNELRLYDYTNVGNPQMLTSLPYASFSGALATSEDGNYLFSADHTNGFAVFDCAIRNTPRLLTTFAREGSLSGQTIAVRGKLVFYGDSRGVNVLDVTDPANPVLVAWYDTPGKPYGLYVENDDVFVADEKGGMEIIRLGDVNRPTVQVISPTTNSTYEASAGVIAISGNASDIQGVVRVSWSNDRGGSGVATGTTSWDIAALTLSSGSNVVTITVEDANGNIARDSITVISTPPDMIPPLITITEPTPESQFATESDTVTLSGSVGDNRALSSVVWSDTNGNTGAASLNSGAWSVPAVSLQTGPNTLTVTASDFAGNTASETVVILRIPEDTSAPSIAISFPASATEFAISQATLNVSGEASDDVGVKQVRWNSNRGGAGMASGTDIWSVNDIVLQPGLNSITVIAEDESGKISEDNLAVTYTPFDADADGIPDDWEREYFVGLGTAGSQTDTGSTGISDFLKFALGIDPLHPDVGLVPRISMVNESGLLHPTFSYRKLIAPGKLDYRVGLAENLADWDWSENQIEQIGVPTPTGDGVTEEVTVRLKFPVESASDQKFLRLRVLDEP